MNRLHIGTRLGLAFGLVLLITALIAALGVWRVSTLKQANERIANVELERNAHAQEWRAAINLNWTRAAASLRTSDEGYAKALAADMAATTDKASTSQKKLEALMDDGRGKQLLTDVASGRTAYVAARTRLLERKKAGEDVAALVDSELRPLADRYLEALTRVTEHADNELRAFEAQTLAQATRSQWVLATAALVSVLLGVTFAMWTTRSITGPVHRAVRAAEEISQGNLANDIHATGQDEMARLLHALANMQQSLSRIVSHVREGSENVSTASTEISQGNNDLSARTEQQASALQQTAASMEELNATVKQNAESARQANQLAVNASTVAAHGGEVVGQVVNTMKGINDSSKKIADIIGVIDSIAFQTNILALNAAVEAARAGEQGRGFAVVAGEVRSLAQRSAQAAKEIKTLIDDSVQRVGQGTVQVDEAGITMAEVVGAVRRVTDLMGEISAASSEQSQGVSQVGEAVTQMDQVTQQNAALVEEMAAAASSLNNQARDLVATVAFFRLPDGPAASAPRATPPVAAVRDRAAPAPKARIAAKAPAMPRAALARPVAPLASARPPAAGNEADWESF